jgi:protocatechuate 4,5-dioxygenase beta chain
MNSFFLNNWPTFCIGVTDATTGPNDGLRGVPQYRVPIAQGLACQIYRRSVEAGFDLSMAQEFDLDHGIIVPLHFLTPSMDIDIIPIFVNGQLPPLPSSERCYGLGREVRRAIEASPDQRRVAVIATGSFSLEVGGPLIGENQMYGIPDPEWAAKVVHYMRLGRTQELLTEATTDRLAQAGNAAGELLAWLAMLGAVEHLHPGNVELHAGNGHAFGIWPGGTVHERVRHQQDLLSRRA